MDFQILRVQRRDLPTTAAGSWTSEDGAHPGPPEGLTTWVALRWKCAAAANTCERAQPDSRWELHRFFPLSCRF